MVLRTCRLSAGALIGSPVPQPTTFSSCDARKTRELAWNFALLATRRIYTDQLAAMPCGQHRHRVRSDRRAARRDVTAATAAARCAPCQAHRPRRETTRVVSASSSFWNEFPISNEGSSPISENRHNCCPTGASCCEMEIAHACANCVTPRRRRDQPAAAEAQAPYCCSLCADHARELVHNSILNGVQCSPCNCSARRAWGCNCSGVPETCFRRTAC